MVRDRGDKHELPDDTIAAYLTPEGYLEFEGNIAAAGLVQMYSDGTETWGELRLPEHVFAASSLRSFHKKPITDDHPDDFVNVDNWQKLARGNLGSNIRPDESGKHVRADMLVTSPELIQKMVDGKRQLSNAYTTVTVLAPGFFEGQPYKYIQTEIEGNANAVVDQARAGPTARALFDSAAGISVAYQVTQEQTMKIKNADELSKLLAKHKNADSIAIKRNRNADATLTIGNESFDIPDELASQCLQAMQAAPEAPPEAPAAAPPPAPAAAPEDAPAAPGGAPVPPLPTATDSVESLRAQIDALTAEKKADRAALDSNVDARVSLVTTARAVLGDSTKTDGVNALELQKQVIAKVYGDGTFDLKNKNADYLGGLFLAATKKHAEDNAGSLLARTFDSSKSGHNDDDLARVRAAVN